MSRTTEHGPRPKRVLGYARVSSEDQAVGTSLQDQQDSIRAYAKARGLTVTKFFVEAESAVYEKIEKRDQIRSLMNEVRAGDLVLCDKLDRWSRDPEFTYSSVRRILAAKASFYSVTDRCDPSTSEGDSMLGAKVWFAREEHKMIKQRLVGTRRLLRDKGYYVEGLPPIGYKRSKPRGHKGLEKNVLQIDPDGAELVKSIFKMCIGGTSIGRIRMHLREVRKERAWDNKVIGCILRNRLYIGEALDTRGVWIKGQQAPILKPDVFAKAQAALDSRRLGGRRHETTSHTKDWLLRELGFCARCGGKMGPAYGGRDGKPYIYYYRCAKRCGVRYTKVLETDAAVSAMVLGRLAELREHLSTGAEDNRRGGNVIDFAARRDALQRKRDRYLEVYAETAMSLEELHKHLAKVDAERTKLEDLESKQDRESPLRSKEIRRRELAHLGEIQKLWRRADAAIRRDLLRELATVVKLEPDKAPVVMWRTPEEIAADERE